MTEIERSSPMGKGIASKYEHSEITVCTNCFHRNVCGDKDYLSDNKCSNYIADNRCVVLPVKVGDRIYRLFRGEITELLVGNAMYETLFRRWKVSTTPYMYIYWKDSFGKTIFLTREEAEEALQKGDSDA